MIFATIFFGFFLFFKTVSADNTAQVSKGISSYINCAGYFMVHNGLKGWAYK